MKNIKTTALLFLPIILSTATAFANDCYRITTFYTGLNSPGGIAVDSSGNVYVADTGNRYIKKITPGGAGSIIAGDGGAGYDWDGRPATVCSLSNPAGVAVDASGNVFIADTGSGRVREILAVSGYMVTYAGGGLGGCTLNDPMGVAVDPSGVVYAADTSNMCIRRAPSLGTCTVFAGMVGASGFGGDGYSATSAYLCHPDGVAADSNGNLYIADTFNSRIRMVDRFGVISTVAGTGTYGYSGDGGPAVSAKLSAPCGVAADAQGNIYIADTGNNCIRRISAGGIITTIAGTGAQGYSGDNGAGCLAALKSPAGVAVDASGNVYIADTGNNVIRKLTGRTVSGMVRSVRYENLRGAVVEAYQNSVLVASTTADALGQYSLVVDDRNYVIYASSAWYVKTDSPAIFSGSGAATRNFTLPDAGALAGTVRQAGGTDGIKGTVITLRNGGTIILTTTADASGNYSMPGVPEGTFSVDASSAGYFSQTASRSFTFKNTTTADFSLVPSGTFAGKITRSDGTTPVEGAVVSALQNGTTVQSTTADASGNYSMTVATGVYVISVSTPWYITGTVSGREVVLRQTTTVNVPLTQLGTLSGKVTQSGTADNVAGSVVHVLQGGTTVQTTTADAFGGYSFTLATGTYTLAVSSAGYFARTTAEQAVYFRSNTAADVPVVPVCFLIGRITDTEGAVIAGAVVSAAGSITRNGTADSAGDYSFFAEPGTYTVTVSSTGHFTGARQTQCTAFSTTTLNISLLPAGTFSGKVTQPGGVTPVAGAIIRAMQNGTAVQSTTTDASGDYSLVVVTGTYTLNVSLTGYYAKTVTDQAAGPRQTATVNITLVPQGVLAGKVTRVDGRTPIPGTLVSVLLDGTTVQTAVADASGDYSVTLATGTYSVIAASSCYVGSLPRNIPVRFGTNTMNFSLFHLPNTASIIDNDVPSNIALLYNNTTLTVTLRPRTFDTAVSMTISSSAAPSSSQPSIKTTPVAFDIDSGDRQPSEPITLTFNYDPLELSGCDESKLAVARYDPVKGMWVLLPTSVDRHNKTITALTDHLCLFAIVELTPAQDLNAVRIYPNPFNPSLCASGLTFDRLTAGSRVKIYTVTGELVRELNDTTGAGLVHWDGRNDGGTMVASGVYIAHISGTSGSKNMKFALIR